MTLEFIGGLGVIIGLATVVALILRWIAGRVSGLELRAKVVLLPDDGHSTFKTNPFTGYPMIGDGPTDVGGNIL